MIVTYIKKDLSLPVTKIHYFSDGCAAQYKNCKHFINLCYHANDFSIDCVWNFFATSHGKSPCDGIGGTVKRLTATASLQQPVHKQILSTEEMFNFCQESIHGIKFVYANYDEMESIRSTLASRFSSAKTIPGIRGYNQFTPSSESAIRMKRVSDDDDFDLEFDFLGNKSHCRKKEVENIKVLQYLLIQLQMTLWSSLCTLIIPIVPTNGHFEMTFVGYHAHMWLPPFQPHHSLLCLADNTIFAQMIF